MVRQEWAPPQKKIQTSKLNNCQISLNTKQKAMIDLFLLLRLTALKVGDVDCQAGKKIGSVLLSIQ